MKPTESKRIVLIHALPHSIAPIKIAFDDYWPEAELVNLVDDSLSTDLSRAQNLSDKIIQRIITLGKYACSIDADGILYTCSAFGKAIDRVKQNVDIPVLKPNEAMFEEALLAGGRIGMLATFEPSVSSMEAEFRQQAAELRKEPELTTILAEEAMTLLDNGDTAGHNKSLAHAAATHFSKFDIVMLAQFSMAQAFSPVSKTIGAAILTSPRSAVLKMKKLLQLEM